MAYNYDNFDARDYNLANFAGPVPGTRAPDFDVVDANGDQCRLLDFETEFLVLEMGSLTCPLFQGRRPGMSGLVKGNPDVTFAVLYVREAHPGSLIGAHRSFEAKQGCAEKLVTSERETRKVLVDRLDGLVHDAYGGYPNSVFIINGNGCVVWASDWNDASATGRALALLKAGKPASVRAWFKPVPPHVSLRVLASGGKGSLPDFLSSLPRLIWNNLVRRNLRLLLGRPGEVAPDTRC